MHPDDASEVRANTIVIARRTQRFGGRENAILAILVFRLLSTKIDTIDTVQVMSGMALA